jgi:hypothetical protein
MTCVIPAWHIGEVLDMPRLKEPRDREIAEAKKKKDVFSLPVAERRARGSDEEPDA